MGAGASMLDQTQAAQEDALADLAAAMWAADETGTWWTA